MDKNERKFTRPPGLRGKEIGLYYRNMAQKRKRELGQINAIKLGASVAVPPAVLTQVRDCLHRFDNSNKENKVCDEFEKQFHHLLDVGFEEFILSKQVFAATGSLPSNSRWSEQLKLEYSRKTATEQYIVRLEKRKKLPTLSQQNEVIKALRENQVLLVVGSTGCGKSTQVPQIILDDAIGAGTGAQCRIVCTQPRRISAIAVAERVAYERCEKLGVSVGYQIRLDSCIPREEGSILYCTTGILLQRLQTDPLMSCLSVVILDEIHERSVETDLLMGLLKKILPHRPDLKVVLMSATVSEQDFSDYFDKCNTLHINGTLFPVTICYLEDILQETGFTKFNNVPKGIAKPERGWKQKQQFSDRNREYIGMIEPYLREIRDKYDLQVLQALKYSDSEGCENLHFIEYLIYYICANKPDGAILVFLPGWDKISKLHAMLQKPSCSIGQRQIEHIQVYPLHSMMPTVNQQSIFQSPPAGKRKIILSTIIAETSVTIDDVVYVINSGRTKMTSYNTDSNIQILEETWVTRANSQQRKGRAGRVQPGICYNLFSKARERMMEAVPTPEILRCKLESIILNIKLLHIKDTFEFFKTLISVPNSDVVKNGIILLTRLEALDEKGSITPLGMHLARLPIDPQMGKMLLMAALFRCVDPITSVAAGLSFKSAFYIPLGKEKKVDAIKQELSANTRSDHLLIDNIILNYRNALENNTDREFCYKNYLSRTTIQQLENMKQQFAELLKAASFIGSSSCSAPTSNVNSNNLPLLRAIISAGLYPNMAHLRRIRQVRNRAHAIHTMSTPEDGRINFHPSSVNSGVPSFDSSYFVYFQKQKSTALYILDATMVFPMSLIIFGDGVQTGYTPDNHSYISVGKSLYFKCDTETAEVILNLRQRLQWLLQKKALYPSPVEPKSSETHLVRAIQILLSLDDLYSQDALHLSSDGDE